MVRLIEILNENPLSGRKWTQATFLNGGRPGKIRRRKWLKNQPPKVGSNNAFEGHLNHKNFASQKKLDTSPNGTRFSE